MLTIRQTENGWEIVRDGVVLSVHVDGTDVSTFARYEDAVGVLASLIDDARTQLAAVDQPDIVGDDSDPGDGLLPQTWQSPDGGGICFSDATGDGRNFGDCDWSWRDPGATFVPLMLQTSTDFGHFGAELAGFVSEFWENDGTPGARGRFFDSEAGRQFRDMLLDGRRFSVSVDPGAVTYEDECLELDEDGWCAQWQLNFLAYQIIGVTGTPFAGFENAQIELGPDATVDTEPVSASAAPGACGCAEPSACSCQALSRHPDALTTRAIPPVVVRGDRATIERLQPITASSVATLDVPLAPPRSFFDDPDFLMPTPLTITNQHRVLGHVESGGCHTGFLDRCVTPPRGCDFQDFLQGRVETSEGEIITTGVLTWGMDHPDHELSFYEAMALYANSSAGWADVTVGYDRHGTWISGVLRPGLTEADVRILRALSLSGDWRVGRRTGRHELIGILAVNYPGYPITAGASSRQIAAPRPRHSPSVITAAGMVPQGARREPIDDLTRRIAELERRLAKPFREELRGHRRDLAAARLRG